MRNMNQGAFLSSLRLQLSSCYRVKILVLPACESCVKTLLGCTVRFHEKRGQGRVFCECRLPYLLLTLINWNGTLKWLLSKKWQEACFFSKTQILDQNCCWSEEKNQPAYFSWRCEAATILLSQVENTAFEIMPQIPGSKKQVSLQFQSCVNTCRTHCTIPWKKGQSEKKVLWVLTAMPVTLIRWNSAVRRLQSFKWQAACFFQKFQILNKAVVMKRKMNHCVFLADLRLQISNIHWWKILVLP